MTVGVSSRGRPPGRVATMPARFPEDVETVRTIFREYEAATAVCACFEGFERELAGLPGAYAPPEGALFLARKGDRVVGCVALRPHAEGCEIKRLFVRPEARGSGLGRGLMASALAAARAAGHARVVLETHDSMTAAHAIYRDLEFVAGKTGGSIRRMALDLG